MAFTLSANLLKWLSIAQAVLAPILSAAGVSDRVVTGVVNGVADAEVALGPGTGPQKLAAVQQGVNDVMVATGAQPATIQATNGIVATGVAAAVAIANEVAQLHAAGPVMTPVAIPLPQTVTPPTVGQ